MVEQHAMQPVQHFRIMAAGRVQPVLQHRAGAAADHRLDRLDAQRRSSDRRQRMVDGGGQVAAGVQQSTVQVEADDGEGKIMR